MSIDFVPASTSSPRAVCLLEGWGDQHLGRDPRSNPG